MLSVVVESQVVSRSCNRMRAVEFAKASCSRRLNRMITFHSYSMTYLVSIPFYSILIEMFGGTCHWATFERLVNVPI